MLAPLRLASHILGPAGLQRLDFTLRLTWLGHNIGKELPDQLPASGALAALAVYFFQKLALCFCAPFA